MERSGQRLFPSPRAEARAGRYATRRRRVHRPVFVDDSGRRRRLARVAGAAAGGVALVYLAIVAVTFAGVPGLGRLEAPGLGELTNPAGDQADVGTHPVEQAVPEMVADLAGSDPASGSTEVGSATTAAASPTTAPTASTTTTTAHGSGSTTTTPSPSSTVPERGGPPTSRPGHP